MLSMGLIKFQQQLLPQMIYGQVFNVLEFRSDCVIQVDETRYLLHKGELTRLYGSQKMSIRYVDAQLEYLYSLLDLTITFGNGLLSYFMVAHRTLCMVTHVLAEILASLYKQSFGCSVEDQEDDGDKTQDASVTDMGEGAGARGVGEQIEDEDQLLGTEKGEEKDALNGVPSKHDKRIEMELDLKADAFSVSENVNDDETEEPELDSAMGETGWMDLNC